MGFKLVAYFLLVVILFSTAICSYFTLSDGLPKRFAFNQDLASTFERPNVVNHCNFKPDKELIM